LVREVREMCIEEPKEQGHDVAGPSAYCLPILEPTFDTRTSEELRSVNGRLVEKIVEIFVAVRAEGS
jgi:hypothetical protein